MYERGDSCKDIAAAVGHGENSIYTKAMQLGAERKVFSKHDIRMQAIYKDKEWCYDRHVKQHMSFDEMAEEAHCTRRVIEKWCGSVYGYNVHTYRHLAKLTPIERQIVMAGRLGDGHITKGDKPLYIESHAENQKDYIFWKYEQLKTLRTSPPKYTPPKVKVLYGKEYLCQGSYRMSGTVLDELAEIRDMPMIEIIDSLTELGVALYFLDDGSRNNSNWLLCTGVLTEDEVNEFINVLYNKFGIVYRCHSDKQYGCVSSATSKIIDGFILKYLPNDIDIVRYKVLQHQNNKRIKAVS